MIWEEKSDEKKRGLVMKMLYVNHGDLFKKNFLVKIGIQNALFSML